MVAHETVVVSILVEEFIELHKGAKLCCAVPAPIDLPLWANAHTAATGCTTKSNLFFERRMVNVCNCSRPKTSDIDVMASSVTTDTEKTIDDFQYWNIYHVDNVDIDSNFLHPTGCCPVDNCFSEVRKIMLVDSH